VTDDHTTVAALRQLVEDFVQQRDWNQFHSPKNLSMSLAIEAAELMEHFQWIGVDQSRNIVDAEQRQAIGEELADVLSYALALANEMQFDISSILAAKMQKNAAKYPAEKFRGKYK
jgi:NTP pyrophosphatase (non-canonical NTP hydrolase)